MENKRIVFVVNNLGYGGAQKMISFVAKVCSEKFEEVYLISLSGKTADIYIADSISVKQLNYVNEKKILKKVFTKYKVINDLRKELKKINPAIVCAFGADSLLISKISSCFSKKIKVIGSERNSPFSYPLHWKIVNKIMYYLTDGVVFQTEMARDFYGKGISRKSVVIPNPYSREGELLYPYKGERKKIITAAAASFEYRKGIDILIEAYSIVRKKYPDYQLVIYGKGPLLNDYKNLTRKLAIQNDVLFPGPVRDVAKSVHDSSVFVLPSRNEGIPNVLIEVMGAGVPTVSANCLPGGPAFLTNHGKRGLLVEVEDIKGTAEAIIKILENKELSEKISTLGIEIKKILEPRKISEEWVQFFIKILKGK